MTTYAAGTPGATGTAVPSAAGEEPAAPADAPGAAAPPALAARPARTGRRARPGRTVRAEKAQRPGRARGAGTDARAAGADARGAGGGLRGDEAPAAPAAPGAPASGAAPAAVRPRADCTADTAGGLTFDVRLAGAAGAASPPGDAALLLRLRGGEGPEDTVRLPLAPAEAEGTLRAVLPSIMTLPEGRWDAYLALGEGEPRRLLPGVHDLRSLIGRVPRRGRTWLGVRIPYATKYGNLTVRSWLRWPHAEAGPLCVSDGCMVLEGRLYGARLSATARLEASPRDGGDALAEPVSVPVVPVVPVGPDGTGAGDPGGGPGGRPRGEEPDPVFTARLPLDAVSSGHRVWDLWVRPSAGEERVRLARILDDVADKGKIFTFPPRPVTGPDGVIRSVRPYYTLDNDLSLRVSCDGDV